MERLGEGLKKLALAGIGTAAYAVEKSADILDTLAKKGEETVEQGKVLNKELKHNVKSTIKDYKASNGKMHRWLLRYANLGRFHKLSKF